jgi:hypothetical protein
MLATGIIEVATTGQSVHVVKQPKQRYALGYHGEERPIIDKVSDPVEINDVTVGQLLD